MNKLTLTAIALLLGSISNASSATPIYLNDENITVSLGSTMSAQPFATGSTSLARIIDADSADTLEAHTGTNHVYIDGGMAELDFDLGMEYDLQTLHFWNYSLESWSVDTIVFTFFNASHNLVGSLTKNPDEGTTLQSSEDYELDFPSNVQYVNALLSGTNGRIDFSNIGFTAEISTPVPEPVTAALFGLGLAGIGLSRKRKAKNS